jgi:hypothetical protein
MIMVPEAYNNQPELEQYPEITNFLRILQWPPGALGWAGPDGVQRR